MKAGDIVRLCGSTWSSYERHGEMGLLLTEFDKQEYCDDRFVSLYAEVMWFKDAEVGLVKIEHLEAVDETQET